MRYLLFALMLNLAASSVQAQVSEDRVPFITEPAPEENLIDSKIYFFAHSMCQGCRGAFAYLYSNHQELSIPITDMKYHHNLDLYKQCVKKFDIKNAELRLPLICMGNHYIMGWDDGSSYRFEQYLRDFQADFPQETNSQPAPETNNQ